MAAGDDILVQMRLDISNVEDQVKKANKLLSGVSASGSGSKGAGLTLAAGYDTAGKSVTALQAKLENLARTQTSAVTSSTSKVESSYRSLFDKISSQSKSSADAMAASYDTASSKAQLALEKIALANSGTVRSAKAAATAATATWQEFESTMAGLDAERTASRQASYTKQTALLQKALADQNAIVEASAIKQADSMRGAYASIFSNMQRNTQPLSGAGRFGGMAQEDAIAQARLLAREINRLGGVNNAGRSIINGSASGGLLAQAIGPVKTVDEAITKVGVLTGEIDALAAASGAAGLKVQSVAGFWAKQATHFGANIVQWSAMGVAIQGAMSAVEGIDNAFKEAEDTASEFQQQMVQLQSLQRINAQAGTPLGSAYSGDVFRDASQLAIHYGDNINDVTQDLTLWYKATGDLNSAMAVTNEGLKFQVATGTDLEDTYRTLTAVIHQMAGTRMGLGDNGKIGLDKTHEILNDIYTASLYGGAGMKQISVAGRELVGGTDNAAEILLRAFDQDAEALKSLGLNMAQATALNQALITAFGNTGSEADQATEKLNRFAGGLASLARSSRSTSLLKDMSAIPGGAAAFKNIQTILDNTMTSSEQKGTQLLQAISQMPKPLQDIIATMLAGNRQFGVSKALADAMTHDYGDILQHMRDKNALDQAALQMNDTLTQKTHQLAAEWQTIVGIIGIELLPLLSKVIDWAGWALSGIADEVGLIGSEIAKNKNQYSATGDSETQAAGKWMAKQHSTTWKYHGQTQTTTSPFYSPSGRSVSPGEILGAAYNPGSLPALKAASTHYTDNDVASELMQQYAIAYKSHAKYMTTDAGKVAITPAIRKGIGHLLEWSGYGHGVVHDLAPTIQHAGIYGIAGTLPTHGLRGDDATLTGSQSYAFNTRNKLISGNLDLAHLRDMEAGNNASDFVAPVKTGKKGRSGLASAPQMATSEIQDLTSHYKSLLDAKKDATAIAADEVSSADAAAQAYGTDAQRLAALTKAHTNHKAALNSELSVLQEEATSLAKHEKMARDFQAGSPANSKEHLAYGKTAREAATALVQVNAAIRQNVAASNQDTYAMMANAKAYREFIKEQKQVIKGFQDEANASRDKMFEGLFTLSGLSDAQLQPLKDRIDLQKQAAEYAQQEQAARDKYNETGDKAYLSVANELTSINNLTLDVTANAMAYSEALEKVKNQIPYQALSAGASTWSSAVTDQLTGELTGSSGASAQIEAINGQIQSIQDLKQTYDDLYSDMSYHTQAQELQHKLQMQRYDEEIQALQREAEAKKAAEDHPGIGKQILTSVTKSIFTQITDNMAKSFLSAFLPKTDKSQQKAMEDLTKALNTSFGTQGSGVTLYQSSTNIFQSSAQKLSAAFAQFTTDSKALEQALETTGDHTGATSGAYWPLHAQSDKLPSSVNLSGDANMGIFGVVLGAAAAKSAANAVISNASTGGVLGAQIGSSSAQQVAAAAAGGAGTAGGSGWINSVLTGVGFPNVKGAANGKQITADYLNAVAEGSAMGSAVASVDGGNSTYASVGGTLGYAVGIGGSPAGGALGAAVGSFIGSLFGDHTKPATSPDIYDQSTLGPGLANAMGSGYNGLAPFTDNGAQYTEDPTLYSQLGGKSEFQYISQFIASNPTEAAQVLTPQEIQLFSNLPAGQSDITGGKNGIYNLANGQSVDWQTLLNATNDATQAIENLQSAAQDAAGTLVSFNQFGSGIGAFTFAWDTPGYQFPNNPNTTNITGSGNNTSSTGTVGNGNGGTVTVPGANVPGGTANGGIPVNGPDGNAAYAYSASGIHASVPQVVVNASIPVNVDGRALARSVQSYNLRAQSAGNTRVT